ncbi:aspartyl protease family protein [Hymenobacter sp. DG25B]|uniref:aspartyl protease family protein n=1 Tax=Hymenobacter sp. DG25B TaxID=1385664 RepID=UPI0006623759|nr:aspartyl protease family protein [Hymenobacter sp. DG25B]
MFASLPTYSCASRLLLYWRRALLGFLLLLLPASGFSQPAPFQFIKARKHRVEVPFDLQRNLIIVSTKLNGRGPYNFMLDTGVGTSLITDPQLQQELQLPRGQRFQVAGVGEESALEAFLTEGVRVELPGVVAPALNMLVFSDDVLDLSSYVGIPVHGILGRDVFRSFVVEIDPSGGHLILYNPTKYKHPLGRRWTTLPLEMEGDKAYITAKVTLNDSLTLPLKLILDTGAGHALSLETGSDKRLTLPPKVLRTQLGRGLSGYINGYIGRVTSLQLGRYKLKNLLTSFPDDSDVHLRMETFRNGNIGLELLKRFSLVIDYPHNRLLLRPNLLFHDPFEHDMCGLDLVATGPDLRSYVVVKIQPGSPAAEAALQPGDELVTVNLVPANFYTLTVLSRLLHSTDGRSVLFVVRRSDGELHTAMVKLRRQI